MLKDHKFWVGFIVAYIVSLFFPASQLFSLGRKKTQG